MTLEEKKAEDSWQSKDLWYKLNANESTYKTGFQDGYREALKVRINTTTISDAPLMEKEQLAQAKEILKRFVKWFDYISESENWKTIVDDACKLLEELK